MQLLSFDDFDRLTQSNNTENDLIEILGNDYINNLKKIKLTHDEKENLEHQLSDIADILGAIPGLSPLSGILKGIKLLSKTLW